MTYWVARRKHLSGHVHRPSYNIRARTEAECWSRRDATRSPQIYEDPVEITVKYGDAFDLITKLFGSIDENGCEEH